MTVCYTDKSHQMAPLLFNLFNKHKNWYTETWLVTHNLFTYSTYLLDYEHQVWKVWSMIILSEFEFLQDQINNHTESIIHWKSNKESQWTSNWSNHTNVIIHQVFFVEYLFRCNYQKKRYLNISNWVEGLLLYFCYVQSWWFDFTLLQTFWFQFLAKYISENIRLISWL